MNLRANETVTATDAGSNPTCKFVVLQQELGEDDRRTVSFCAYAVAFKAGTDLTVVLEVSSEQSARKLIRLLSRTVSHVEVRKGD